MATMTRAERVRRADPHRHFLTHCAVMPGWHKLVIIAAFLVAVAGFVGVMIARSGADAHLQFSSSASNDNNNNNKAATAASDKQAPAPGPMHVGSLSHAAMPALIVGVSVMVGFVGGWLLRAYLVQGMCLVVLAIAAIWGLAHFGVLHPGGGSSGDASSGGPATWLVSCGLHLKNAALAHLPSAGSGAFAAFLGFRRW